MGRPPSQHPAGPIIPDEAWTRRPPHTRRGVQYIDLPQARRAA